MNNMLGLLYLASPTLPIGSFAYSQGLEKAIEDGLVQDRDTLKQWCFDAMRLGLSKLDLVLMTDLYKAISDNDVEALAALNDLVFASRETKELLAEERNLGQSLKRLLITQSLLPGGFDLPPLPSFLCGYTLAGISLNLQIEEVKTAFLWSWLENQTAVATKAIPIGQTDAQSILLEGRNLISELAKAGSGPLMGSMPGQVMMSALHETQYSRLFRS